MYDCQHKIDHTPTKNYITPAIYLCDEVKAFYYMELLSKIELLEAKRIFASQDFREILDGYFWEAYFDLSHQLEKELRSKGLMKGK
ncbi:hypothetical protein D3OALGA1CA_1282 [Olavius algarvensis associated proteobacterium Delta 3]|nr:hypothetical protein D3OALGB2SA_651 [Olavius algarvensis associated proteobacterium Delta 3]CAB5098619.1 hypothetical protein D3OALGA1CA_1282 [Olavius algarvensis associated proteobacterium Delta 3]